MSARIFDLAPDTDRVALAHRTPPTAYDVRTRLDWYDAFEAAEARRRFLFRDAREETEMQLMRRPIPTARAYALFGLLLGTLPFAAVILRIFRDQFARHPARGEWWEIEWGWLMLLLLMNVVSGFSGKRFGASLGERVDALERRSWHAMFCGMLLMGFLWGIMTGTVSGLLALGFGAIFAAAFAVPAGMVAFALFTPLHRLTARGGMIDARHFWPLACGIVFLLVAFILSPNI